MSDTKVAVSTVEVTADLKQLMLFAIESIHAAHSEFCISRDRCDCLAQATKISEMFALGDDE